MLEVKGWTKHAEEDTWANGCIPETAFSTADSTEHWQAETLDELLDQLAEFCGVDKKGAYILEDKGRVDFTVMENGEAQPATEHELASWKLGETRLWDATYTFYVEDVTRVPYIFTQEEIDTCNSF